MIMINIMTQRKEPIAGLFSLEDVSSITQYNISLRVPLFIKLYGRIALFSINLCPYNDYIK